MAFHRIIYYSGVNFSRCPAYGNVPSANFGGKEWARRLALASALSIPFGGGYIAGSNAGERNMLNKLTPSAIETLYHSGRDIKDGWTSPEQILKGIEERKQIAKELNNPAISPEMIEQEQINRHLYGRLH